MSQVRAGSGKEASRPRKGQGNGKRNLAQIAHVVCSGTCALTLRDQLLRTGDLTRDEVESGQVEFGPRIPLETTCWFCWRIRPSR